METVYNVYKIETQLHSTRNVKNDTIRTMLTVHLYTNTEQ